MGIIKTKGIILSESNMNDFDKMVTILTPNGKIGCAAKGARRPKSLLMAGTQFLCFGEYMLYQGTAAIILILVTQLKFFTQLEPI